MQIKVKSHKRTRKNGVSVVRNHSKASKKGKKSKADFLPMTGSLEGLHPTARKRTALMRRLSSGAGRPNPSVAIRNGKKSKSRNYMKESEGMGKPKGYTKEHSMRKKANIKARRLESPKKPLKRKSNKPTPGKYKSGGW